jgi:hypothetical protein
MELDFKDMTQHEIFHTSKEAERAESVLRKKGFRFVSWIGSMEDWERGDGEMHMKKLTTRSSDFTGISCQISLDGSCSGFDSAEDFWEHFKR